MKHKIFVLLPALALACFSQTLASRHEPQIVPKPSSLQAGIVRHAAVSSPKTIALIDPLGSSGHFSAWELNGSSTGPISTSLPKMPALLALSTDYFVWIQLGPLQSTFHVHKFAEGSSQSIAVELTQIVQLQIVGENIFVVHGRGSVYQLSQLDLQTKAVQRLDEFSSETPVLVFGYCDETTITILDAAMARYRIYRLDSGNSSPWWTSISSNLIWDLKNRPAPFQAAPTTKAFRVIVLGHFVGPDGSPWFLLAATEKGVGMFAIRTDSNGRESARIVLKYPDGDSRRMAPVTFSGISADRNAITIVTRSGEQLVYSGVFQTSQL